MRRLAIAALVLVLLPSLAPAASAHHSAPETGQRTEQVARFPNVTWRAVAFAPAGNHALIAGEWTDGNLTHDVLARYTPGEGVEVVRNRSGAGLVDVSFDRTGRSLVVGLRNTLLLGTPGSYRDVWEESSYAQRPGNLTFYGLGAGFQPGQRNAVVTGSSLLRMAPNGSLETIHGGRNAFFRSLDWNPVAPYALVEAAIQRQGRAVLGTVWRTDGSSPLAQEDNVAIYGRQNPGGALLNSIAFAPNGSFALLAGRDGAGASLLSWAPARMANHTHEDREEPHDHRWRYLSTSKEKGPITCIGWHPTTRYAITTGLRKDVLGIANARTWMPLVHRGPDLYGCAMHPSGRYLLAVGENGTVLRVPSNPGPVATVVHPAPGSLVAPRSDQRFLVDVIDRGQAGNVSVTGRIGPNGTAQQAFPDGPWWRLTMNTSDLNDGRHELIVEVRTDAGRTQLSHPFLVNNERFTPEAPTMQAPSGLEGQGTETDGVFTLHWEQQDAPVVYEVQQRRTGEGTNATQTFAAGSSANLTVRVDEDGSYLYRVRAVNAYNRSAWSEGVVVNVVLDSDGDGVPDEKDPQPYIRNTWGDSDDDGITDDVELKQCSDPNDPSSTPATDDDGDGIRNGRECLMGTDPHDPNDPHDNTSSSSNGTNTSTDGGGGSNPLPAPGLVGLLAALAAASIVRRRVQ